MLPALVSPRVWVLLPHLTTPDNAIRHPVLSTRRAPPYGESGPWVPRADCDEIWPVPQRGQRWQSPPYPAPLGAGVTNLKAGTRVRNARGFRPSHFPATVRRRRPHISRSFQVLFSRSLGPMRNNCLGDSQKSIGALSQLRRISKGDDGAPPPEPAERILAARLQPSLTFSNLLCTGVIVHIYRCKCTYTMRILALITTLVRSSNSSNPAVNHNDNNNNRPGRNSCGTGGVEV